MLILDHKMFTLDKAQAKKILIDELEYDAIGADQFLKKYPPLYDDLSEAVERWLKDRTVLKVDIFGLSIDEVMKVQGYNFLLAVSEINRLFDSDMSDEKRNRIVKHLKRPVPRW